jgi:uncharacterized membrane protein YdfJ with MMPL/SSD domain
VLLSQLGHIATRRSPSVLIIAGIVFAAAAACGLPAGEILTGGSSQFQSPGSQYARAGALFHRATGQTAYYGTAVLLQGHENIRASASARLAVVYVGSLLARQDGFERLADFVTARSRDFVSRDGHETVLLAAFASPSESAAAAAGVRRGLGSGDIAGLHAIVGGPDVTFAELDRRTRADLGRADLIAVVALLLLAPLVFRGVVAGVLPLLVGMFAVLLAFTGLRVLDQLTGPEISVYAMPAAGGLGLGLGIDYSLLLLSRYREELVRGADPPQAVELMLATAGRTVLFSSLTIAAASAVLLVFPLEFLDSLGISAAITALAAGAVALLVLPAALVCLGSWVDVLAPSRLTRWLRAQTDHGLGRLVGAVWRRVRITHFWEWLARSVTRWPLPIAVITMVVLLAAAVPALGLRLIPPSAQLLPAGAESRRVERELADGSAHDPAGAIYTIYRPHAGGLPVRQLAVQQARIAAGRAQQLPPRFLGDHTWELGLLAAGSPYSQANQRLLAQLRAGARGPGALVSGVTAYFVDQRAAIAGHLLPAALILFAVTVAAMLLLTGGLLIAVKAWIMNLLTVAAGMGLLVAIFQDGVLAKGGLEEANLVFLAAIAFALATDYELFLISRISEERDRGLANAQAVAAGLTSTGPLITSAAALFCIAVGSFAAAQLTFVREFGVGAALMVLIDASLVRALLVPSLMVLFGEANWWAPARLQAAHNRVFRQRTWASATGGGPGRNDCRVSRSVRGGGP